MAPAARCRPGFASRRRADSGAARGAQGVADAGASSSGDARGGGRGVRPSVAASRPWLWWRSCGGDRSAADIRPV